MAAYRYRFRDDDSSGNGFLLVAAGAVLGLAAGIFLAQRVGGVSGLTSRLRDRFARARDEEELEGDEDEIEEEVEDFVPDEELEERVLEAFRNDPILSERAVDIGAIGAATIELTGWVHEADEADHAVTLAGGVPGVESVVNRLEVRAERDRLAANARRVAEGDDALTEARWEGQQVGTGRRRQGNSAEPDRHADPKVRLEDRWLSTDEAVRSAADDTALAERRRTTKKTVRGDRTGGSPVAPGGVPKADHVAEPDSAAQDELRAD
jgi:BON domain-containing protein